MANVLIVDLMLTDSSSSCFSAADGIGRTKRNNGKMEWEELPGDHPEARYYSISYLLATF